MSNFVEDIADSLKTVFDGMDLDLEPIVEVWTDSPIQESPIVIIAPPTFEWPGDVWTDGDQLGGFQWNLSYYVYLYVELGADAIRAQSYAVDYVVNMAQAIQSDPTLGGEVDTAKMMSANLELETDENNAFLLYECKVDVVRYE